MEAPSCQKAKCCVPTKEENKIGVGILGLNRGSSKSTNNTPTNSRKRPSSIVMNDKNVEDGEVQVRLTVNYSSSEHDESL